MDVDPADVALEATSRTLSRVEAVLSDIHQLITSLAPQRPDHTAGSLSNETLPISRLTWLKEQSRLNKLRASLREVRQQLAFALTTFTSTQFPKVHSQLKALSVCVSAIVSAQQDISDGVSDQADTLLGLSKMMEGLGSTPYPLSTTFGPRPSMLRESPGSLQALDTQKTPGGLSRHSSASSGPYISVSSATKNRQACARACACQCHMGPTFRSWGWTAAFLGQLFIRSSGPILRQQACNKRSCKGTKNASIVASFHFPQWLVNQAILLMATSTVGQGPHFSLRVLRVRKDTDEIFTYVRQGYITPVQAMIEKGEASPNDVTASEGRSVLQIALYAGRPDMAQFLLDQNADYNYEDKYFNSAVNACWELTFKNMPTVPPWTVGENSEDSDFLSKRKLSDLHKVVLGIIVAPLREYLVHADGDIEAKDITGRTPLHWAAARGDVDNVHTLLEAGANPNARTEWEWTALHEAALSENKAAMLPLLQGGVHVDAQNNRGNTALAIIATTCDNLDALDVLYRYGANVHQMNKRGETPLHRAVLRDHQETVTWMLSRGADPNATDLLGHTALHSAVYNNSAASLRRLLEHDSWTDLVAFDGSSLLHNAARSATLPTLEILLHACLDNIAVESVDKDGLTASQVFNMLRHENVVESEQERFDALQVFETLLARVKTNHGIEKQNLGRDGAVLPGTTDEFFDAAEKLESRTATSSAKCSLIDLSQ